MCMECSVFSMRGLCLDVHNEMINNYLHVELSLFLATCDGYFDAPPELLNHRIHHILPKGLLYLLILSTTSQYVNA